MVNGYSSSQQIQPQVYQRQQVQPQVQAVETEQAGQNVVQNQEVVPSQYQNPMCAPNNVMTYPSSASGVSINIISPSVYGANNSSIPYSPIYNYPVANTVPAPVMTQPPAPQPPAPQMQTNAVATEEKTKKKNIVPLTDEYIKTLENYMKNSNEQVRIMGVKEVMARFKEDESRRNDAALTALLNMSLQDKNSNVRLLGMSTVAAGYSAGDKNTAMLLNRIQQTTTNYNEDALLAANALMKMSGKTQKVEVSEN